MKHIDNNGRRSRAIVANGMEPVPAKPKKEKPAPEPEVEEA